MHITKEKLDGFWNIWKLGPETGPKVFIIDNCPAHPSISNLTNIHLVFLPPNTTFVLQPIDQGVIRSLKVHYRRRVVRLLCSALENNKPLPKISILSGMKILADSWQAVTKQTIINCLRNLESLLQDNRMLLLIRMTHLKIFKKVWMI